MNGIGSQKETTAALAALTDLNIAVPQAVCAIGHDNTMIAELSNPLLTSIGLDTPDLTESLTAFVLPVCQGGSVVKIGPCSTCRIESVQQFMDH